MKDLVLKVADKVNGTPGGRYKKNGKYSGEEFYEKYLLPSFRNAQDGGGKLVIDFDGCFGYPSSFLDESFGKLGREYGGKKILKTIEFISNDQPGLVKEVQSMIAR